MASTYKPDKYPNLLLEKPANDAVKKRTNNKSHSYFKRRHKLFVSNLSLPKHETKKKLQKNKQK